MIPCPICGRELRLIVDTYEAPFFDKILLTSISCECGFKHADSIVLGEKEPSRYRIKANRRNLFTKVIRSTSGTIRIPEIGVSIEPGPASQAFITNLEGVLWRVAEVVKTAMKWNESDEEKVRRCEWILERINGVIEGDEELTIILEDPFGNSLILSEESFRERLSEMETKELKSGLTVIELTGFSEEEISRL
ncbi:MAG: ZPR1 zinc finger domain-containing protein [Archaeoglobaceae archaeon]|nr:ZPR1 zinc finger domain-containing protein [Archaeoglobaceae archaeon]MDW8128292.1 ZPR1 zinc finger domain-containing protein [Archaeoglobaceae archaeon]